MRHIGPRRYPAWLKFTATANDKTLGVNLWNISGLVRKLPQDDGRELVGARMSCSAVLLARIEIRDLVRLAAFRLVEAGLEAKPGLQSTSCSACPNNH